MFKKNKLQTAIAIACVSASLGVHAAVPTRPNIVTIMVDDMGYSDVGMSGGEISTPNLDSLIQQGTHLTRFYSAPTSTPARSMFFTGRDNHAAGVGNMKGFIFDRPPQAGMPGYEGSLTPTVPTFPELLKSNQYYTVMTGKWDLGNKPGYYPQERGFINSLTLLPGGDVNFLSDANGNLLSSTPDADYPPSMRTAAGHGTPYRKNGTPFDNFPANAYSTDFYTNTALAMVANRPDKTKPFYMHISHIAPHGPFQAPEALIQKYLPIYAQGTDILRAARFAKLKTLGLVAADAVLPPLPPEVKPWAKLTANEKLIEARRLAIYAGMVEKLDQSIGKVIQRLKDTGEYNNTVFFVMSDNGAAHHEPENPLAKVYLDANYSRDTIADLSKMGNKSSYISPSEYSGLLNNTPLSRFKGETFDGGLRTFAFAFAPGAAVESKGKKYDCLTSVMDISATILNLTGTSYPNTFKGYPIAPLDGKSMASLFSGDLTCQYPNRVLGLEFNGGKMLIKGNWKLSQRWLSSRNRWDSNMYLFNTATDPFELTNLRATNPAIYSSLLSSYVAFAKKNRVIDVGSRIFSHDSNLELDPVVATGGGMILGGTQLNYSPQQHFPTLPLVGAIGYADVPAAKMGDTVDIAAEIYTPMAHQGTAGNVMVASYYKPATATTGEWSAFKRVNVGGKILSKVVALTDTANGAIVAPDFSKVPAFSAVVSRFPVRLQLPIYEGKLATSTLAGTPSFAAGTYYFWISYMLNNGTIEKSARPIVLEVKS